QLGHFRITAKLGEGGMGAVYRAEDGKLGREVAVKVLPQAFVADPERLARFEREARVLATLNHPHIAGIHEVGEDDGVHFLVMELAEGRTLDRRLAEGPVPLEEALPWALQIARALEEAHERGIVHRDLKPQNVVVTPAGGIKLLDFGLAKAAALSATALPSHELASSPTLTMERTVEGVILGTAGYMSPEQAKGRDVDKRADIWAFGVLVTEMLTGKRLFAGETVSETLAFVMTREPDLRHLPDATPRLLRDTLARCLERDPRRRLRDIGEARIALERVLEGEVEEAPAPELPSRRAWAFGAVAAAAAVLAALATWLVGGFVAPQEAQRPLRKLDLVAEGVLAEWFTRPSLSPDGARIAYNAEGGIWIRDLDRLEARRVATPSEPSMLFWSPDSRSIGFRDAGTLWRVDADGGRPAPICELPGTTSAVGAAWHEDGRIAFGSWRGAMYVVPAGGGRPEQLFEHDGEAVIDYHDPLWLPDGRLLFTVHLRVREGDPKGRESGLAVFDGSTLRFVEIAAPAAFGSLAYDPETQLLLYVREGPNPGMWARPVDPQTLQPTGPESLLVPGAVTLSLGGGDSMLYMEAASTRGVQELVLVDRAGRVVAIPGQPHPGLADPALSPDGRRVAFTAWSDADRELWVVDLGRGTSSRLTFDETGASAPVWTADSVHIVYSELRGMSSTIVTRRADGTGGRTVVFDGAGYGLWQGLAMFAPGGRHFVAAIDEGGPKFLRIADVDESGGLSDPRPFFSFEPDPSVLDARISPDGSMLAYTSSDSGRPEVYLTRFPGGEGRWQVSFDGGHRPRWAAVSGELFFLSGTGSSTRALRVVEVEASPSIDVGTPRDLFRLAAGAVGGEGQLDFLAGRDDAFDVTPDGERFVMVRAATARGFTPRMVLVQNWRQELPRR
ncbi:MAG TPA: protein kinase, partial [Actinomycetota bacterium]|nr:protein kinase [Actinomycetota bacterium]